jgi:hypothetical protein
MIIDRLSSKVREQAKQLSHLQQELDQAGKYWAIFTIFEFKN